MQTNLGVVDDPRVDEQKEKDYQHCEIASGEKKVKVRWVEKEPAKFRKFPIRNQDGSSSCVAQSTAKVLGINNFLEEKEFVELSAKDIYMRRRNDGGGMWGTDAMDKQAQSIIGEKAGPRSSVVIVLADNNEFEKYGDLAGYDIESVKPGQTCRLVGIGEASGAFMSKNMLIRKVIYYPTSAVLEVDINREGIDELLVNFKRGTIQIEKDGIPTSYTAV